MLSIGIGNALKSPIGQDISLLRVIDAGSWVFGKQKPKIPYDLENRIFQVGPIPSYDIPFDASRRALFKSVFRSKKSLRVQKLWSKY